MKRHLSSMTAALLLAAGLDPAGAATQLGDHFSLAGFGTLGGVRTNSDEGKYGRDRQTGGADKTARFDVDSNLGLQLTGTAASWLSGTVQALASKRDEDHIDTKLEWAYALVKPIDGLSIRAGRMATPAFAISDSRNIGYANTWVRAPNEVYALNVFRNFDGADATYRHPVGPVSLSVTVLAGDTSFKPLGVDAKGKKLRGVNLQIETEWATFRYGKLKTDVSVPAFGTFDDPYAFTGYGVSVDRDDIVAQAEYVTRRSGQQPVGTNANGWYVMGGYHIGSVLPYVIVSRTAPDIAGSPFYLSSTQRSKALGVRWDAFSAADFKFQIDHVDTDDTPGISFTTPKAVPMGPGGPPSSLPVTRPVTVFSVTFDFTF